MVAAFSARARPGVGISMPLAWEELSSLKSDSQWTIVTAREYLSFQKDDPWAGYWKSKGCYPPLLAPKSPESEHWRGFLEGDRFKRRG